MEGFRRSEIRTNSQSSDDSSAFVEPEETANLDTVDTELVSIEWTNEKHSLYLKSMEASFVNQLHNSMNLLGWHSQKRKQLDSKLPNKQLHCNTCTPSGEFKVFRGGCWKKINYGIAEPSNKDDGSSGFSASPWIQHFRTACKHQVVVHPSVKKSAASSQKIELSGKAFSSESASSLKKFDAFHSHSCDQDFADQNSEVSDQNFVDEDIEGQKASSIYGAKRMKTQINTSRNDQVVPFTNSPETEDATGSPGKTHASSG